MKRPLPYRWDAQAATSHPITSFDPLQDLYWRRAMDYAWLNDGLPKDQADIARICRFSGNPGDFELTIWPIISRFFYLAPDGMYRNRDQEDQRKKLNKFRKSQQAKAKLPRGNRLQTQPPDNQNITEEYPKRPKDQIIVDKTEPLGSPELTASNIKNPIISLNKDLDSYILPEHYPPVSQSADTEKKPEKTLPLIEPKINHLTPAVKFENSIDPYFDLLAAWENLQTVYPQKDLGKDEQAKDWFFSQVRNDQFYQRVLRAISNYKTQLEGNGWTLPNFISFVEQWQAWEDHLQSDKPGNKI